MKLSDEYKMFLSDFFIDKLDWIRGRDMLDPEDIKIFTDAYEEYLTKSEFSNSNILNYFLLELRYSQYREMKIKRGEIILSRKELTRRMYVPVSSELFKCKNEVIKKWFSGIKSYVKITSKDVCRVDQSMEPKLKQNEIESRLSWEAAQDAWSK